MQAIIFDCDGTLADTMPAHFIAWQGMLQRYKLDMDEDRFYALGGWPSRSVAELLVREAGLDLDVDALANEKEAEFEKLIRHVQPIEQTVSLVRKYRGKLPIAVATGGTRKICTEILRHIGIADAFDAIVCCEDVQSHKPAPDIFLEAARRIGADPAQCRVYEDTDPGLEAGRRAGMECIDVRTFHMPRRVTSDPGKSFVS